MNGVDKKKPKVFIVMTAYNVAKTIERTYRAIPSGSYDEIIVVDDGSSDNTAEVAWNLGLRVVSHEKNKGYGATQKTLFEHALKFGADIVVLLHPDYQYDPGAVPAIVKPLAEDKADVVYASRMLVEGTAKQGGMPLWKRMGNKALTGFFNTMLSIHITDAATGYIAYSRKVLESIPWSYNDDRYCFDEQVIIQIAKKGFRIAEIPIPSNYEDKSTSINFKKAVKYGARLFGEMMIYKLNKAGLLETKRFS